MNERGNIFVRLAYFIIFFIIFWIALIIIQPFENMLLPLLLNEAFNPYSLVTVVLIQLIKVAMLIAGILWIFTGRAERYEAVE